MSVHRVGLVALHTSPLAPPGSADAGGMNVYVVALAEALARRGLDVELLTRSSSPDDPQTGYTPNGIPVQFLRAGPQAAVAKDDLARHMFAFRDALRARPVFDLLHSHYWLSGAAALTVAEEQGIPHVQSLHTVAFLKNQNLAAGDHPEPQERLWAEQRLIGDSQLSIASTEAERDAIVTGYGATPSSVLVIPPGVDVKRFHPRRTGAEAVESGPGRPVILTLGRIQPLKGQDLAIRAIAGIDQDRRPKLVIAGAPTPGETKYLKSLHALVAELGVADDVEFVGTQSRERTAEWMRSAALVLLPSHSETFGLVALEAAASATPVIASRASGMQESVSDGVSGILLDSREPLEWASAIDAVLSRPETLARLSAGALAFGARHSWESTADTTLDAYRAAVGITENQ
ncbi:glycosyltransferase [Subtercola sp. PAMC28395]|uniref:glycosyltransferase n=1 Tax=Subtercola sp. PAMC28395 TaxID=2846775 RepID=UPI001C0B84CF|nr:glycosyltransferase [Subtercola sp. PAMC28395]QWT24647.1 glycosyltransferase [Subtercola sp. PAMC28395]